MLYLTLIPTFSGRYTSIAAKMCVPFNSDAAALYSGFKVLQNPHHGA